MTVHSRLFDRIRIRRRAEEAREEAVRTCDHPGCDRPGEHRAPMGRGHEGRYFHFCLDHVREYNASYNYFAGMTDEAVATYQKDAMTGHRPTWSMAANATGRTASERAPRDRGAKEGTAEAAWSYDDPLGVFARAAGRGAGAQTAPQRNLPPRVRAAFETMGLDEGADPAAIKARYKELVKRFHPDANGGDRSCEARLQEIIHAYDALKAAGMTRTG